MTDHMQCLKSLQDRKRSTSVVNAFAYFKSGKADKQVEATFLVANARLLTKAMTKSTS